ncbi:carbohydrate kinase [Pseudolysobacter antarcticus]|uniref:Carbohydrate kinase n=1 Tax=Pseudolysobacter antarcticus TaxID=2511995 RepID=A0A411HJU7_9GAMM|nr:carbohydrate kinase [Pseudolysobacter antarcticus]QBB70768.1 carbohydrate kinase [Pseudolysobacter antarcticus]
MKKIVCFGEALIDFLGAPAVPETPRAFLQNAGGAPANVAVAVARLGGDAEFVGMLSRDMFGDFLRESLAAMRVGCSYIRRTTQAPTALAFVSLDPLGERSFSFYRPPAADLLFHENDFETAMFAAAGFFHVCSNSLTEAAIAQATFTGMQRARTAGALVSFDMNLRPCLWAKDVDPLPRIRVALASADVVKLSADEYAFLIAAQGDENRVFDLLWSGATQLLIVTNGAAALQWYTRHAHGSVAAHVVCAVDTTAAGDAFVGGLLFQLAAQEITAQGFAAFLADEKPLESTLHFATACGAIAVTRPGAFASMPTLADVQALPRKP